MENRDTFRMTYSAQQQEEIQSIRRKYIGNEKNNMAQLRALDAKATNKATAVSVITGIIGTLIMGIGMSLIMTDFGSLIGTAAFPVGIIIGVIGMATLALAYPIYNHTLKAERNKIAPEIIRLTDELLKQS